MHQFGDILLHVNVMNAQPFGRSVFIDNVDPAAARQRKMRLRKLITLGQIGIIINLLVKRAFGLEFGVEPQAQKRRLFQRGPA